MLAAVGGESKPWRVLSPPLARGARCCSKKGMCGRYTLRTPAARLRDHFALEAEPEALVPRYNIAPSQPVLMIAAPRRAGLARWGLVPHWASDPSIGVRMINARAESLSARPAFREAFLRRRCLIPADGFYEWRRDGRRKLPMHIRRRDGEPFRIDFVGAAFRDAASDVDDGPSGRDGGPDDGLAGVGGGQVALG